MVDGKGMNVAQNGEVLEEVECFKYLGSDVAVDGGIEGDVKFRMNEVGMVCGLMKRVFKYRSLGMSAKRKLYEGLVVCTNCAVWGCNLEYGSSREEEAECNGDEVYEEYVRSNKNGSNEDPNEKVRRRMGVVKELIERAKQGVSQWFGHVERMEEESLVKMITGSDVRGVRPRERPRMGWIDSVKRASGARGRYVEKGRVVVRDKKEWRTIVSV